MPLISLVSCLCSVFFHVHRGTYAPIGVGQILKLLLLLSSSLLRDNRGLGPHARSSVRALPGGSVGAAGGAVGSTAACVRTAE